MLNKNRVTVNNLCVKSKKVQSNAFSREIRPHTDKPRVPNRVSEGGRFFTAKAVTLNYKYGAKKHFFNWLIFGLMILALLIAACENSSLKKENRAAPVAENKQTEFENDLQTMKTANFEYIFVFRRKDGGAFDGEDRKYLRANSPTEINRFISTDDGKAFIAGSKYKFPPENLEILRLRFNIEDYSTPPEVNSR